MGYLPSCTKIIAARLKRTYSTEITCHSSNLPLHRTSSLDIISYISSYFNPFLIIFYILNVENIVFSTVFFVHINQQQLFSFAFIKKNIQQINVVYKIFTFSLFSIVPNKQKENTAESLRCFA